MIAAFECVCRDVPSATFGEAVAIVTGIVVVICGFMALLWGWGTKP